MSKMEIVEKGRKAKQSKREEKNEKFGAKRSEAVIFLSFILVLP